MAIDQFDVEETTPDLTGTITVLTHTPSATYHMQCQGFISLSGLDGTGGNFELTITVGGVAVQPDPQIIVFAATATAAVFTTPFIVPANNEVLLRLKSPNAGDSVGVTCVAYLYDVSSSGLAGDKFPVRQDQLVALSGGLGVTVPADSATITQGTETSGVGTYAKTNVHDGLRHVITDSGAGTGIELYYTFNTESSSNIPVSVHMHGWFQDGGAPFTNTMAIQAWNFNTGAMETIETLTHATSDKEHELPLTAVNVSDGTVGTEGDVRIGFKITAQEASSTLNIDHLTITYGLFVSAADVVDEWETQSQADPTGFHVNVMEIESSGTIDGTVTPAQTLKALLAFISGITAGGGTGTITFQNQAGTKNVITLSGVDRKGNRTSTTLDFT